MSVVLKDVIEIFKNTSNELDQLQGKTIFITGAAGFLGYEFIHVLSNVGFLDERKPIKLILCDNFITRNKPGWLSKICLNKNVTFIEHDITLPVPTTLPKFDYIIHAASIASPTYYRKFPIETIDANVNGLRNLLDYAQLKSLNNNPIFGMLFFSTSEIYGDPFPEFIPTDETYRGFVSCTGPRACYDESKRLGETLCVNFYQKYNVPVKIARPFNNYGPGLNINDKRLLPDLFNNVLKNEDIELLSDGKATRTFCYISDAISGYIKILVSGKPGESYNIGTENPEISVLDTAKAVAKIAKKITKYTGKIVYKKSREPDYLTDNPNRRCPKIIKARDELGYNPKVTLEDGLVRSIYWYLENKT